VGGKVKDQPYAKVSSYEGRKGEVKKVVLLYSGGLDTSVMLKWIQDEYQAQVIALTIDIGQQADDLEIIRKKALKLGALEAIVRDAKSEFAYHYLARGIKANASYQGNYHLSTPLGRPLLAKLAVEVAREFDADTIAHGCTGKGNDQVRIEGAVLTLAPEMKLIAPVREWSMGRDEEIGYAKKHKIPVKQTKDSPYSYDDNMWGVTAESGEIENPALVPPLEKILQVCVLPEKAPNKPELIKLEFIKGIPVSIDGKHMRLDKIITELNLTGAKHGVGITHHIEDRLVGLKVRGIYEAPAASIIICAHKDLEKYVCTRVENEFKQLVDQKWAYLCYGAMWYEPLMTDLNALIDSINEKVSGTVTVRLHKGRAEVVALETPNTLFDEKLATFMKDMSFNQNASAGFIEIYSLQMRLAQERQRFALFTVGEIKKTWLALARRLVDLGYVLYATEGTHEYFARHMVDSILLHKMYSGQNPNLEVLLRQNRFDVIFHEQYSDTSKRHLEDVKAIRDWAVKTETKLISDLEVASRFVERLEKRLVHRSRRKKLKEPEIHVKLINNPEEADVKGK
jgi:argininosuccinate synthase